MYIKRRLPRALLVNSFVSASTRASAWSILVVILYSYAGFTWLKLPFLPLATIGTAVAFYVGFKNNAAYDRFWEGRKIWGGVVNDSRTFATSVLAYLPGDHDAQRRLIYRQLAWINSLRVQLRQRSRFLEGAHKHTQRRLDAHDVHMRNNWDHEVLPFLSTDEGANIKQRANPATQILKEQSLDLARLKHAGCLDLFHQIDLMQLVREMHALQGRCERIKNTPFPRQYAEFSRLFVRVCVFLAPLGLLGVFEANIAKAQSNLAEVASLIPMLVSASLIAWVFLATDAVGDASEDPFERSISDVPMNALCRTIERDLRDMLDESPLPDPEAPTGNILY